MSELSLSYSSIKDFEVLTPHEWKEKWIERKFPKETKRAFSFGSLLDCLLFEPETFDKRFAVATCRLPSDAIFDFICNVHDEHYRLRNHNSDSSGPVRLHDYEEYLGQVLIDKKYWSSRKPATNLKNVLLEGEELFNFLLTAGKKIVVSQDDVDKCLRMRENAWNDSTAREYLIRSDYTDLEFQKTLKSVYYIGDKGVNLKCVFDVVYTDTLNKRKRVVDLKSTASGSNFGSSVDKYRYGAQMGLYCYSLFRAEEAEGFEIDPPINLVIDKKTEQVLFHEYTWDDLKLERWGTDEKKGWHYLIKEILERYETNNWE